MPFIELLKAKWTFFGLDAPKFAWTAAAALVAWTLLLLVRLLSVRGKLRKRFTRDPRGTRYEIVGPATDGRLVAIVCRIKSTGKLLFITTYLAEQYL